eukprot:TRINITY_DN22368_c0_g1_i1.p1 TRINITY_DN22368_c0_g1~~TRINITY_DN22368_c0_g1_i1.p1  ORF type:complete len:268 (+),score=46.41 TRINITY_DN22368_c0_g1_i1:760-1563(+)
MKDEDPFLLRHDNPWPYASEVAEFNGGWRGTHQRAPPPDRLRPEVTTVYTEPPRLRGLRHPGLFRHRRIRRALAEIPGLKVVAVICDPTGRIEKLYQNFHRCGAEFAPSDRCGHSLGEALERDYLDLERWSVAASLRDLLMEFGTQRFLLLHQEALRLAPRRTYGRLAAFLGARGGFPETAHFLRYGASPPGPRSEMCSEPSVLRDLKRRLNPEYEALEKLLVDAGESVPAVLRNRVTRCDRQMELQDSTSGNWSAAAIAAHAIRRP